MRGFRISSSFAIVSLIAANLFPAIWAIAGTARVENLLFLYWLETWIIGFYTILKIHKASAAITEEERNLMKKQLFGRIFFQNPQSILTLFVVQYSILVLFYGAVLFGFLIPLFLAKGTSYTDRVFAALPTVQASASFIILLFSFFVSHGISHVFNYLGKREFEISSPARQMFQPYDRIIAMHSFVVLGAVVFTTIRNLGIVPETARFTSIATLFIKLLADLAGHIKEHMILKVEEPVKNGKPEIVKALEKTAPFWMKRLFLFIVIIIGIIGIAGFIRTVKQNSRYAVSIQPPRTGTNSQAEKVDLKPPEDEVVPASIIQTKASSQLDVVFVSAGYKDMALFKRDAEHLEQYILSRKPYSDFASLFHFHLLETSIDFGCRDDEEHDAAYVGNKLTLLLCDGQKIHQSVRDEHLPYNRIVVLINDPTLHGVDSINGPMTVEWGGIPSDENIVLLDMARYPETNRNGADRAFLHEFSHSFGLIDEYVLFQTPTTEKDFCPDNCCHSSACSAWKNIPGAQCIRGCLYPNWFRSSEDSIMRSGLSEEFSPVALDIIRKRLRRHMEPELVAGSNGISWNKPYPGPNPQAHEGDMLSFLGETWNRGAKTAGQSFMSGRIDINSDGTWDIQLPPISVVALASDIVQRRHWNNAWVATAGNHIFEVCVDVTNTVKEADDDNNCKPIDFTVEKN